jgi:hypothetical protein
MERSDRIYSSFAQAMKFIDESDNPIRKLFKELNSYADQNSFITILVSNIESSSSNKMLQRVINDLRKILRDDEAAMAVLLDWCAPFCDEIDSDQGMKDVYLLISKLDQKALFSCYSYLEMASKKKIEHPPVAQETYDIPAFLRRQID